jgi:hypothetical protein
VTSVDGRGRRGDRVRLLTSGEDGRGWPESERSSAGGWPWWPAQTSRSCGVPVNLRRRGWPAGVQLVEDVLPAATGGSGWTSRRRIGRRPARGGHRRRRACGSGGARHDSGTGQWRRSRGRLGAARRLASPFMGPRSGRQARGGGVPAPDSDQAWQPGPNGPSAGMRRRSGLGRASGSAQSSRVDILFFEIFFSAKTNPRNAQKMFRGTKNTQKITNIPGKFLEID